MEVIREQGGPVGFWGKVKAALGGGELFQEGSPRTVSSVGSAGKTSQAPSDPLAVARRMNRLFLLDHDALDRVADLDELWNELERDAVVRSAKTQLATAIDQEIKFERGTDADGERHLDFVERIWRPASPLRRDMLSRQVDAYGRGFVLGEMSWEQIATGEFAGFEAVASIRRIERQSFRLLEDAFSRPLALEIWRLTDRDSIEQQRKLLSQNRIVSGSTVGAERDVITSNDAEWQRFLFLSSPANGARVAGAGAYVAVWPHWYFLQHVNQFLRTAGERFGTIPIVGQYTSPSPGTIDDYPITKDQVFASLEEIQTNYVQTLPDGWKVEFINTPATGLADFLLGLADHARKNIELGYVQQTVSGGGEATGGTLGANVAILSGTFGDLVRSQQQELVTQIDRLNEMMLRVNFGDVQDPPRARFENPDPAAEQQRFERIMRGVNEGIIDRNEAWLREIVEAPPLDNETIKQTGELRQQLADAGIIKETDDRAASRRDPLEILEQVGMIGPTAARAALREALPTATPDEIDEMLAEATEALAPVDGDVEPVEGVAAAPGGDVVEDLALNGAQISALEEIIAKVAGGQLPGDSARALIAAGFPRVPPELVERMVGGAEGFEPEVEPTAPPAAPRPVEDAEPEDEPAPPIAADDEEPEVKAAVQGAGITTVEASDARVERFRKRLHKGLASLEEKVVMREYRVDEPAPIFGSLRSAFKKAGFSDVKAMLRAKHTQSEITQWLETGVPQCETKGDKVELFDQLRDYYSDDDTIREMLDG